MTKEEALLRLTAFPPHTDRSFWTAVMVESDGPVWFLWRDASYTSASQRWDVFELGDWSATETDILMFDRKSAAEDLCDNWNGLAEKDSLDCVFLPVRAVKTLGLV